MKRTFIFKHIKIILLLFLGFIFSNCATLINGTSKTFVINSHPQGATVYIDGLNKGETPLTVNLSRKDENIIRLELLGYQNYTEVINKEISHWFYTNIFLRELSIFAFPLDYFSGGMYDLTPVTINQTLQKSDTTSTNK